MYASHPNGRQAASQPLAEHWCAPGVCAVTTREVKQLWRLFKALDLDQDSRCSSDEMIRIPHLEFNPLGQRVVANGMAKRGTDKLTFKARAPPSPLPAARMALSSAEPLARAQDFALVMAVFAPDAPYEQKLRLAFEMFDFDGDKLINRQDIEVRAPGPRPASPRHGPLRCSRRRTSALPCGAGAAAGAAARRGRRARLFRKGGAPRGASRRRSVGSRGWRLGLGRPGAGGGGPAVPGHAPTPPPPRRPSEAEPAPRAMLRRAGSRPNPAGPSPPTRGPTRLSSSPPSPTGCAAPPRAGAGGMARPPLTAPRAPRAALGCRRYWRSRTSTATERSTLRSSSARSRTQTFEQS